MAAVRIHPRNRKIFEFRNRPLVLVTATEHYGAVMNRPFRFERYLADAAERGFTLTRLFTLYRELQMGFNPYSTCKPDSSDYVAPFERTGPGLAADLLPKYDLDRPNPEFYDRLHRFVSIASELGIVVEVVLFSNSYFDAVWALSPLNPANNVNELGEIHLQETMSRRHPRLWERQVAHARRIVTELNRYDNVIYEICNEPIDMLAGGLPDREEINAWLSALIRVVREAEAALPHRHLIAGQEAWRFDPWEQSLDRSFREPDYDVVNVHALPNTTLRGRGYELGHFMSKQLRLRELRDFGLAAWAEAKPANQDEDNAASRFKDVDGWTIHRKRAWTTLLTGGHYDCIDFSLWPHLETGTPESQRHLRAWLGHLARFVHALDLVRARPLPGLVTATPPHVVDVAFGVPCEDIAIYLADERELPSATFLPDGAIVAGAGDPIQGAVGLDLVDGAYEAAFFDPKTAHSSHAVPLRGGANGSIELPAFTHDVVVRIRRLR